MHNTPSCFFHFCIHGITLRQIETLKVDLYNFFDDRQKHESLCNQGSYAAIDYHWRIWVVTGLLMFSDCGQESEERRDFK